MDTPQHPNVVHPNVLTEGATKFNGWVARIASTTLGSTLLFWVTFLVPLITIPMSDSVKLVVSIVFSSWFQAWALPVLQGAQNRAEAARDAKADTDHQALTSLHHTVDAILAELRR